MSTTEPENSVSIKQLLAIMVKRDASDLYLTADLPPSYRINNAIYPLKGEPSLTAIDCEQLANKCMSEKQRAAFATDREMNLALNYSDIGRFRVNIHRQRGNIGMVIRRIKTEIPTIEELHLPLIFKDIATAKRGLVILVGGTGCGKSTSLAAMIDWRNSSETGHIITIEDPIEYVYEHKKSVITQREVGTDTSDYMTALKNTLRQAPDVILIGEIRDSETMEHALNFAETGHLCMATLHANNANQAMERILNFFPKETHPQISMNLSLNLRAMLSQRLVKTTNNTRLPAVEILINTPRVADLIMKNDIGEIKEAMAAGKNYGMQTFDQNLFELWGHGLISDEEALLHADSVNDLRLRIKMAKLDGTSSRNDADQLASGSNRVADLGQNRGGFNL